MFFALKNRTESDPTAGVPEERFVLWGGLTGRAIRSPAGGEPIKSQTFIHFNISDLYHINLGVCKGSPAERCEFKPQAVVAVASLFAAWRSWCESTGYPHSGNVQSFGKNLRAAFPEIKATRPQEDQTRERCYKGIGLVPFLNSSADRAGNDSMKDRDGALIPNSKHKNSRKCLKTKNRNRYS